MSRSAEETQRRIEIGERLQLVLADERLDLSIEALTDVLALVIISMADDRLQAFRVVEAVSGSLPRRIDQNWDAAKLEASTAQGSETVQ